MIRRSFLLCLLATTFLAGLSPGPAQSREWSHIRIGTEGAYYPFNYIDESGELAGFDIDIANALCEAMDAECEFVRSSWHAIIPGLLRGKYDAIVASMSITSDRDLIVDFTEKYYQTPARFVARKGTELVVSREGLRGKSIGAQRSTTHANYLLDNYQDVAIVRLYDTQDHVNLDLYNGRLDAALADSIVLEAWIEESAPDFELVGQPLTDPRWFGNGAGIAVREEDDDLREQLDEALREILADGTYRRINDKYFDFSIY